MPRPGFWVRDLLITNNKRFKPTLGRGDKTAVPGRKAASNVSLQVAYPAKTLELGNTAGNVETDEKD